MGTCVYIYREDARERERDPDGVENCNAFGRASPRYSTLKLDTLRRSLEDFGDSPMSSG